MSPRPRAWEARLERIYDSPWIYHVLLAGLFISLFLQPFESSLPFGTFVIRTIYLGILVVGLLAVSHRPVVLAVALMLAFPSPLLRLLDITSYLAVLLADLATILTFLVVILGLLGRLMNHRTVTRATVSGVTAVYLLLGVAWSAAYMLIETAGPCSFNGVECLEGNPPGAEPHPGAQSSLFYYSFVTLSTLGYGDMSPRTEVARTFAILEAIIGQLFLVVVLARIVSLMNIPPPEDGSEAPEGPD